MRKVRGEEEETAWQGILSFLCSPLCSGFKRRAERWNTEFLQQVVLVVFPPPPFSLLLQKKAERENRYDSQAVSFVPSFGMCRVYIQIVTQSLNTLPLRVSRQPQVNTRNRVAAQTSLHAHTHTHKSLSLSHTHTHTHNLKCPICIPNTGKKVSSATKNKKCLVRVFCSDKQKLKNQ